MPSISETITRLAQMRGGTAGVAPSSAAGQLTMLEAFGDNPGALRAKTYLPPNLPNAPALVVVLHGCTQNADGYDVGSGWSQLADRYGFALLFPEQQRQNNPNLCFNWFSPEDSRRGSGEPLSIRQMIGAMADRHGIDPARVFVTGLSAGGAMASVMLATYPEVFVGGAIIAGLPFGCADTIPQALDRMRGEHIPSEAALAALVRKASDHAGPWPTISIWHGTGDMTVRPANAAATIGQWCAIHGVGAAPSRSETVDGQSRRVWRNEQGRDVIEAYSIAGMGHGTPIDPRGPGGCGSAGAYMLDVGISSTSRICRFWGLSSQDSDFERVTGARASLPSPPVSTSGTRTEQVRSRVKMPPAEAPSPVRAVGTVIDNALRAAGLMK